MQSSLCKQRHVVHTTSTVCYCIVHDAPLPLERAGDDGDGDSPAPGPTRSASAAKEIAIIFLMDEVMGSTGEGGGRSTAAILFVASKRRG